jgi:hypothetical protein
MFFAGIISGPVALGFLVLSVMLLITVLLRVCPVYLMYGYSTFVSDQNRNKYSRRLTRFLSAVALIMMIHHFVARPWFLDWGAPERIRTLELPGDDFTNGDHHTRAVLIHAQPKDIWPWIMQLGQERGGFYSYAFLENFFRAEMHNVYELRSNLQQPRQAGDTVWLAKKERYDGNGYQVLAQIIPEQSFVMMGGPDYDQIRHGRLASGTWSIYLHPEDSEHTWLIARSSGCKDLPKVNLFLRYLTFEVPHFVMEQKMLRTIKRLSEEMVIHR